MTGILGKVIRGIKRRCGTPTDRVHLDTGARDVLGPQQPEHGIHPNKSCLITDRA